MDAGAIMTTVPVVQIILSSFTLLAALLASFLTWRNGSDATDQRENQARREEWWRRFQYAMELALDQDPQRSAIGNRILEALVNSDLAGNDELDAVDAVFDQIV